MVTEQASGLTGPPRTELQQVCLTSAFLGREVELSILRPAAPASPGTGRYPVLYLNDGQDLPALQLQSTLERMYAQDLLHPFVVVAIHANEERQQEYGTAARADYHGRGSKAAAYTRFVLEELLPHAQTYYKVSAHPAEAVFAGFSLGGLSAFDLVWHHPKAFARAGVFSGSFWWRSKALDEGYTAADRIMHGLVRAGSLHPTHRFWLQIGTLDEQSDRDGNGVIDSIDDCLDLIQELQWQGLDVQHALRYVQVEGGRHHPTTWGLVMPDFLQWAFGRAGAAPLPPPLPVVRLQLDPRLVVPAETTADSVPEVEAPVDSLTAEPAGEATAMAEGMPLVSESAVGNSITSLHFPDLAMSITRPAEGDYQPYAETYVKLVPGGVDPRQMLREQGQQVQAMFAALTEEQGAMAYAPGKWTVKELLLHQIDTERIFAYRALRFARGDGQALAGFDENDYARNSGANERSLSSLLAEYAATRAATLALVDSFTDEQLQRSGTANGALVTVNALMYILPGHERHHLNIFEERYLPAL